MKFQYFDIFITIATDNLQFLVEFYSLLLQQQPDVYRPAIYAEFRLDKIRLTIFQPKLERQSEFNNLGSSISLCLEVEQLEQAIALISELGYPPPGDIIEASHGREIYAYDPIGNRIILHQSIVT
jgi:predicted enzyme related to lactoylglutathione lyase